MEAGYRKPKKAANNVTFEANTRVFGRMTHTQRRTLPRKDNMSPAAMIFIMI